jgi:hypothetical protein
VNFPNLFADLCKLLPEATAKRLDQLYRDAKQSTGAQMQALLAAFPSGRTIVLLDNFEDVVDAETQAIKERELDEALRAAVEAPPHGVKFLLTTRRPAGAVAHPAGIAADPRTRKRAGTALCRGNPQVDGRGRHARPARSRGRP